MRRYVEWIIRHRLLVIALTLLITGALAFQVKHLRVIIDPNTMLPQDHPFVSATNQVENVFGLKYVIVIGITPKEGSAFSSHVLSKVERMTAAILDVPGVVKGNVLSLSARRAKNIVGTADGIEVRPLMETVPQTATEIEALRRAVRANPAYVNAVISRDERTAAILAEFKEDAGGFRGIVEKVRPIVEAERDASVEITLGGHPIGALALAGVSCSDGALQALANLVAIALEKVRSAEATSKAEAAPPTRIAGTSRTPWALIR